MVQLNFDARQFTPLDNDVIPEGWYNFIIDESNAMPTKDGNPNHLRLVLRFSIIDGPHQGRKVFTGLNMRHTNIQTMEIANRELSAICAAVNLPFVQDTQQLHNIPMKGRVKTIKDPNGVYDDKSEIKSYKPINYVVPGVLAQPGAKPQGAPAAAPTGWAPQQAPQQIAPQQTWAPPQQQAPQQNGVYQQPPQQQPVQQAAPPNGGWQQPQTQQPWGQPPQQAPQQMQAPQQTQPVQQAEPQQAPVQQSAPVGFAAPPPTQQAPQAVQQPQDPAVTAAQQATPPWARQPS
jgi:hypothetical protein